MIDLTRELAVARKAAKKAKKAPAKKPKNAGVSAAAKQYVKALKEHLAGDSIAEGLAEIKKLAEDKTLKSADLHGIASAVLGIKVSKGTRGSHGLSDAEVEKREQQLNQHDADHKKNEEAYYAFVKSLDDKKYTKEDLQAIFEKFNGYKPAGGKSASKKQIIENLTRRMDVLVESRAKSSAIGGRSAA